MSDGSNSPHMAIKLEEQEESAMFDHSEVDSLSPEGSHGQSGLDPTQHSAAMLCDLQCRSSPPSPQSTSLPWTSQSSTSTPPNSFPLLLSLLSTHTLFTEIYKACLLAIWTLYPAIRFPSASRTSTHSPTSSISTPLHLLLTYFQQQRQQTTHQLQLQQLKQLSALWTRPQPVWSTLAQQILLATGRSSLVISAHLLALNDPVQKANASRLLMREQKRLSCRDRLEFHQDGERGRVYGDRVDGPKGPDKECLESSRAESTNHDHGGRV